MTTLWGNSWVHSKEILSPTEAISSGNNSEGSADVGLNHSRVNFLAWVMVGVCIRRRRVRGRKSVGDIILWVLFRFVSFAIVVVVVGIRSMNSVVNSVGNGSHMQFQV